MKFRRWEFTPPLWAVPVFVVLFVFLLGLSAWQIQRGQAKAQMIAERTAAGKTAPVPLRSVSTPDYQHVVIKGRYLIDEQLLLDSQVYRGQAGFHVWTPLVRADAKGLVLVDRGWVALTGSRADPPSPAVPTGPVQIEGLWSAWPEPGLRVANHVCDNDGWPRIVVYPTFAEVACNYQRPVANGLVLLDEDQPNGFPRHWTQYSGLPPSRHYGYAFQWFALAITLLVIFVSLNTRRLFDEP